MPPLPWDLGQPIPPLPLHLGASPHRELALAVLAGPLAGVVLGVLAGAASLPLARRQRRWLLGGGATGLVRRHLFAAAGVGAAHGIVALLVLAWLPADGFEPLASVHPAPSWLAAHGAALGVVAVVLWTAVGLDPGEPAPSGRVLAGYVVALAVAGAVASVVLPGLLA